MNWTDPIRRRIGLAAQKADASLNNDKRVSTFWHNVGLEYMFNREWGVSVKVPFVAREFWTLDDNGNQNSFQLKKYRRYRNHGDVHRLFQRTCRLGVYVWPEAAHRHLHRPPA